MTHSGAAILLVVALAAVACGGRKVEIDPESEMVATRWNATLATPTQLAGAVQVKGTGWMAGDKDDPTETRAFVLIQNALRVGSSGQAQETAVLQVPAPVAGQYFINVHASRNNMGTIIACGNLAPPSR